MEKWALKKLSEVPHTHTWMCACENQLKFNYQRVKSSR